MKVAVLSPTNGGPLFWAKHLASSLTYNSIEAHLIYSPRHLLLSPFMKDVDLFHAAVPLFFSAFRKPIVLTVKGDITIEKNIWKVPYYLAIRKADAITTPSRYLQEKLDLDQALVIPNAVVANQYQVVHHCKKDTITLISITNFEFKDKSEGVLELIKIVGAIQNEINIPVNYFIAGGGHYLEYIKKKVPEVGFNLTFTGFLSDTRQLLERGDIFLYCSVHDNFPNVLLEAMASGIPVITNKVGAIPEMITSERDGFVCDDTESFKENLISLIEDPSLRGTIGGNARKRVKRDFNWDSIIPKYITLYKNVLTHS